MTIYVLGAGPAGLAALQGLKQQTNENLVLIERDAILGGLARTVTWDGVGTHDLGPHKIFSVDESLVARVKALLPSEGWLAHKKLCRIFMNGHFIAYPPSPFSLGKVFGWVKFIGLVMSYGIALIRNMIIPSKAETFKQDLEARVGKGLAEVLFYPIARKLWAPPEVLDVKLSRGRIQTPSLGELIKKVLNPSVRTKFETLYYDYPKGGLGQLWKSIAADVKDRVAVKMGTAVTAIDVRDGRVQSLILKEASGQTSTLEIGADDFVVSTLPLGLIAGVMEPWVGAGLVKKAREYVVLNDLLLVFLHVDMREVFEDSWLIVPDPDIAFHRLSEQKAFDPGMTPNGTILCAEIMGREGSDLTTATDETLIASVVDGLARMGKKNLPIKASRVIRLPRSYPVYKSGFQPALDAIMARLDSVANFRTIGRQGAFNYIGTLDAMDIGYGFANWFVRRDTAPWAEERARTNHYPVLD